MRKTRLNTRSCVMFLMFLFTLLLSVNVLAADDVLSINLSKSHVDITTGFNGADIVLYGINSTPGNIAIEVIGPEKTTIVRHKSKVLGAWVNSGSVEFRRVAEYYDYAIGGNVSETLTPSVLKKNHIGLDSLEFYSEKEVEEKKLAGYREALVRNKQKQGLFPLKAKKVEYISDGFFKAGFSLPPNVPTGIYLVKVHLINNGKITATKQTQFRVAQTGFSAKIYSLAHDRSLEYGIFAALIAMFAGWSAYTFLRRD